MKVLKRTVSCPVISERDLYGVKILMFRLTEYHLGAALIRHGDSVIIRISGSSQRTGTSGVEPRVTISTRPLQ